MEDLIYNQHKIPKKQWRYGFRSSAATGCGWIATYNALRLMGKQAEPEDLIRDFQRQVPLINGNAGTVLFSVRRWFRKRGYWVKTCWLREDFDRAAKDGEVSILFYRWRQKWKMGAHFVALHHTEGGFIGYNTYRNSVGPDRYGESLSGFLKRRKYFGAVLFVISQGECT